MTIRTTKSEDGETLYNAADICEAMGAAWKGKASLSPYLKENKDFKKVKAPLQVNDQTVTTVEHYVLTRKGADKFCSKRGMDNVLEDTATKSAVELTSEKRITELERQVAQLKEMVANMLPKPVNATVAYQALGVDNTQENDTVKLSSVQVRTALRNLCVDHAKWLAEQHGVSDQKDMGLFYDLTFNLLYAKYKYETNFDLKKEADAKNKTGLQIATDYGIINDLYTFAKKILKTPN